MARRHGSAARTCVRRCAGQRLNPVALHVLFRGQSIAALTDLPVQEFSAGLRKLKLVGRERDIARDLLAELAARTTFLCDVGLGYLQLNRAAPTFRAARRSAFAWRRSWDRICRACATCWTSPPSACIRAIIVALLDTLDRLRAKGNTLVVVEHDEDTIRRADHVIDLGPGAGTRGGQLGGARHGSAARAPRQLRHRPLSCGAAEAFPLPAPRRSSARRP